ncbi:MAG: cold shock domain-containing protein [Candidatus Omnitrophota bacterium]
MSKGKVKEYDLNRGCGIVVDFDTGQQLTVYANYTSLQEGESLKEGQEVEYEIKNNRHDLWAVNVRVLLGQ